MKSRKIKLMILSLVAIIVYSSCEEVTTELNESALPENTAFNTLQTAIPGLVGAYSTLGNVALFNQRGYSMYWGDGGTDMWNVYQWNELKEIQNSSVNAGTLLNEVAWAQHYSAIKVINAFLVRVKLISVDDPEDVKTKNSMIAEARFLRAMLYFNLVKIYGKIPLVIDVDNSLSQSVNDSKKPNIKAEFIYQQIEKDLLYGIDNLKSRTETQVTNIPSIPAAQALLGRLYMQMTTKKIHGGVEGGIDLNGNKVDRMQRFKDAVELFDDVIAAGYQLEEEYTDVFAIENEKSNQEVIFAVAFDGPGKDTGSSWGDQMGLNGSGDGRFGMFNAGRVNKEFALSYLVVDEIVKEVSSDINGVVYEKDKRDFNDGNNNFTAEAQIIGAENVVSDSRFIANIGRFNPKTAYDVAQGINKDASIVELFHEGINNWAVYKYPKPIDEPQISGDGKVDYPYIRFADILLMKAEALNEINQAPNDEAVQLVNRVRKRAFNKKYITNAKELVENNELVKDMPKDDIPGTPKADILAVVANALKEQTEIPFDEESGKKIRSGLTFDEFKEVIIDERGWELCFEGHRRDDLFRMGMYESKILNNYKREQQPSFFGLPRDNFESKKSYHFPIPFKEISINSNLVQNCGYPNGVCDN